MSGDSLVPQQYGLFSTDYIPRGEMENGIIDNPDRL